MYRSPAGPVNLSSNGLLPGVESDPLNFCLSNTSNTALDLTVAIPDTPFTGATSLDPADITLDITCDNGGHATDTLDNFVGATDMTLGSRFLNPGGPFEGGMPKWKYAANRGLTIVENKVLGTDFAELHTGYRAYSRELLLQVPWLRNQLDFTFDSELLFQAVHFGYRIEEVPCRTIYDDDASSVDFKQGVVYGLKTLAAAGRLVLHRSGLWPSRKYRA